MMTNVRRESITIIIKAKLLPICTCREQVCLYLYSNHKYPYHLLNNIHVHETVELTVGYNILYYIRIL